MQDPGNATFTQKSTVQKIRVRYWKLNIVMLVYRSTWANKSYLWAGFCGIGAAHLGTPVSFCSPGGGSLSWTSRQHFVQMGGTAPRVTTLEVRLLLQRGGLSGNLHADVYAVVFTVFISSSCFCFWGVMLRRKDMKEGNADNKLFPSTSMGIVLKRSWCGLVTLRC